MPDKPYISELMSIFASPDFKMTPEEGRVILEDIKVIETAFTELKEKFKSKELKELYTVIEEKFFESIKIVKAAIVVGADLI